MNREVLERPFPEALLKSRKGPFGKTLIYIPGEEVIKRLNEAFEGEWSWEIVEHQIRDTEVIVLGKLSAAGIVKMAFGGTSITVTRDGEVLSIADDLKAAATTAIRKAASIMGVALYLVGSETSTDAKSNGHGDVSNNNNDGNGNGRNNNGGNGHARATQKQIGAVYAIARRLGLSSDAVQTRCLADFGTRAEALSKQDASSLIEQLNAEANGD